MVTLGSPILTNPLCSGFGLRNQTQLPFFQTQVLATTAACSSLILPITVSTATVKRAVPPGFLNGAKVYMWKPMQIPNISDDSRKYLETSDNACHCLLKSFLKSVGKNPDSDIWGSYVILEEAFRNRHLGDGNGPQNLAGPSTSFVELLW